MTPSPRAKKIPGRNAGDLLCLREGGSGRLRATALRHDAVALLFREATPHAVRLVMGEGVFTALFENWAVVADSLSALDAATAGTASLAFRMEEEVGIEIVAGSNDLPIPEIDQSAVDILDVSDQSEHVLSGP